MNYIIRPAEENDIEEIHNLILHYAAQGVILERTRGDILSNINNFIVAVSGSEVVGAVTFSDYGKNLKEVRSFAIKETFQGKGIGSALLKALVAGLHGKGTARIFTLTYKPEFFSKNGFTVVPKDDFPEKIWKDCFNCKDYDNCGETALVYQG